MKHKLLLFFWRFIMVDYVKINQVRVVYNNTPAPNSFFVPEDVGTGSVFTFRAYGEVGQSVEVRGGFPDVS